MVVNRYGGCRITHRKPSMADRRARLLAYAELEESLAELSPQRRRLRLRKLFRVLLSHSTSGAQLLEALAGMAVAEGCGYGHGG